MDIKTLKTLEEEFDKKFGNKNKDMPLSETMIFEPTVSKIKAFYRSAIKDLLIECVGEDEERDLELEQEDKHLRAYESGRNDMKFQIRGNILKMFEEK